MSATDPQTNTQLPTGYRVRQLRPEDARALEWGGEYTHFRRVYAHAFWRAAAGNALLWGVEDATEELVGQVFVLLNAEADPSAADGSQRAFLHSFRVRPQHRNLGVGAALLAHAEADLLARGFRWVSLNVAEDNIGAMRLYLRLGYQPIHPVDGHWSFVDHQGVARHLHEPGWRMVKSL